MNLPDDQQWLGEFVRTGEEQPFRRLVEAHSGLVFGTALRIVRDASAAEEIAQNVFVALARKAPFLPRDIPLGAWLHRCAVLEARSWLRGEVRRKRREESAGGKMMEREESLLESLAPVLDDALLDLREQDRAALLLRYMEQRSLRDVGKALGVSDDTAQKRVAKAVESLTEAFRKRGYAIPAATVTVSLLEGTVRAAPATLCQAAVSAALQSAVPATLGGALLLAAKFMSLTKTQTATVCLLLASAPVGMHLHLQQEARASERHWRAEVGGLNARQQELELKAGGLRREIALMHNDTLARQAQLIGVAAEPAPALPPPEILYAWSSDADYVRLPKNVLGNLKLTPRREFNVPGVTEPQLGRGVVLSREGEVSPVLLEALGLDAGQASEVQRAFQNFAAEFHALARANTHLTNVVPPGVGFAVAEGRPLVTLRTMSFPEEGMRLKEELQRSLLAAIDAERTEILLEKQAAGDLRGEFLNFAKGEKWIAATQREHGYFTFAKSEVGDGVSYGASVSTVRYEHLPEELKVYFTPPERE